MSSAGVNQNKVWTKRASHFVHKHNIHELHCSCGTVTAVKVDIFCGRIECKNCFALYQVKDRIGQQCVLDCPLCAEPPPQ